MTFYFSYPLIHTRCDPDNSFLALKTYFAQKKGILLAVKRGRTKLNLLDTTIRYLKTRMIKYLKLHQESNFPKLLKQSIESHNKTYSNVLKGTPEQFNSGEFIQETLQT